MPYLLIVKLSLNLQILTRPAPNLTRIIRQDEWIWQPLINFYILANKYSIQIQNFQGLISLLIWAINIHVVINHYHLYLAQIELN